MNTPVLILLFLAALHTHGKTSAQTTAAAAGPEVTATYDPYFVETRDTFYTLGPRSIVRDLLQDRKGTYWFASWQGIISYNGLVYTNHTLKDGLIHFHVFSVFEDRKGHLWFGTVRGGLYRYDGKSFTLFTTKDGLADNTVNCMAEDRAGAIWFGTPAGASRYDGKAFTTYTQADGMPDGLVTSIILDKRGTLWFGARSGKYGEPGGGIACFDGKTFTPFTTNAGVPFSNVSALLEAKDGTIWVGRMDGLSRYHPSARERTGAITDVAHHSVGYLLEDRRGAIWASGSEPNTHYSKDRLPNSGVLWRYDGATATKAIEKYDIGDSQVFGIAEDKAGNILFGTAKGGCKWDGAEGYYRF